MSDECMKMKKQGIERILTLLNDDEDFVRLYANNKEIVERAVIISYFAGYNEGIEQALSVTKKTIKECEENGNKQ